MLSIILAVIGVLLVLYLIALAFQAIGEFVSLIPLFLAAFIGSALPDIDLALGIGHRSAITHSPLIPFVFVTIGLWRIGAGMALGFGIHLFADIFTKGMVYKGFGNIVFPGIGQIGMLSPVWLGVSVLLCFGLLARTVAGRLSGLGQTILFAGGMTLAFYEFRVVEGKWWLSIPLAVVYVLCFAKVYGGKQGETAAA